MPYSPDRVEKSTSLTKSLTLSVVLILGVISTACSPHNFDQGVVEEAAYIIGGQETLDSDAVSKSTVGIAMIKNNLSHFLCTGVLVSPDVVVTAAHCYTLTGYPRTYVSFGLTLAGFSSQDPLTVEVESYKIHSIKSVTSFFHPNTNLNDVAVLKLKKKAPSFAVPALISNDKVKDGQKLTLAGFGVMDDVKGTSSDVLRHTQVEVSKTWKSILVTDQRGGKGACNGDSGGPGFVKTSRGLVLAGITRGAYDGSRRCSNFGEYTSIPHHLDFIKKSVSELRGVSPRYVDIR